MWARGFEPAWWLPGGHAQTLWATLARRPPRLKLRRERLELPDGDFLDLDWTGDGTGPIVVVLHGLEGSVESGYARGFLKAIEERGWRGVVMHFRGCSGEPNRLPRSYHAGETGDLATVVEMLRQREPETPLAAIGVSIGGSALLNWLGRCSDTPIQAAVGLSVPFVLANAADRLDSGLSRLYQWHLLRQLRRAVRRKFSRVPYPAPFPLDRLDELKNFWQFDDAITAPLHGFAGVDDYYRRASCRGHLRDIQVPTLVVHAEDDPFMTAAAIPEAGELSEKVQLEVCASGGHVGFVEGQWPWRASYWLEGRVMSFLAGILESENAAALDLDLGHPSPQPLSPPGERG